METIWTTPRLTTNHIKVAIKGYSAFFERTEGWQAKVSEYVKSKGRKGDDFYLSHYTNCVAGKCHKHTI